MSETLDASATPPPLWGIPPDTVVHPGIMEFSQATWHHPKEVWDPIRQLSQGETVTVAVLDTGVDTDHPYLPRPIKAVSFIPGQSIEDGNNHGTHCSGTILGREHNIGCAPKAQLITGKVLSNSGSGSSSGIAQGVRWATDNGADIISMSLGGGSSHQPTIDEINRAFSKGVIVVIAAGNSGFSGSGNTIGWPARSGRGICVGATRSDGSIANFSSGGSQLDIAAPGQIILSTVPGGGFGTMSGTSMATPMVAGYFALVIDIMRGLGHARWTAVEAVKEFIKLNAIDVGRPGHDPSFGHGVFKMNELLASLLQVGLKFT